ncbi:MAG: two-component regulator propeller domain-containing protein [Bacteroidia bacterium]
MKQFNLLAFAMLLMFPAMAQQPEYPIGEWRSHLSYKSGLMLAETPDRYYCISRNGMFYYGKDDNALVPLSKINGYSDVTAEIIRYDPVHDLLFIGYTDGNMDIQQGNTIRNVPDIARKQGLGRRNINDFYFYEGYVYISTGFGIVVYDIEREEFRETYGSIWADQVNPDSVVVETVEIHSVTVLGDTIFAATEKGILAASLNEPNLLFYRVWHKKQLGTATSIRTFNSRVYAFVNDTLFQYNGDTFVPFPGRHFDLVSMEVNHGSLVLAEPDTITVWDGAGSFSQIVSPGQRHAILDENGKIWVAHPLLGMLGLDAQGINYRLPNGPASGTTWDLASDENIIYATGGGLTITQNNSYNSAGIYIYENSTWKNYNMGNQPLLQDHLFQDVIVAAPDPRNRNAWFGSYLSGIAFLENDNIAAVYDTANSALQLGFDGSTKVAGMAFDQDHNLWISNIQAPQPLVLRSAGGEWASFNLGTVRDLSEMVVDDNGYLWISRFGGGLVVYDPGSNALENGQYLLLNTLEGQGGLPENQVHSLAKDRDGEIWVGTGDGVAVFYDPSLVFTDNNFDAQQIFLRSGDENGILLLGETVTAIAVDGANRKWFGSENGAWLTSPDGTRIITNFNADNSPLPGSRILDIAVNNESGEVFFATDKGLMSYRGTATKAGAVHSDVYVYPNPVREGYLGPIAVKGLVQDANVKITDISGNMVFELTADGGQAVWQGTNFQGDLVKSGVYLIFSTDPAGQERNVAKVLIIR